MKHERKASAEWKGNLKGGSGTLSSASGVHKDTEYDFSSRFESGPKTNPEELIAAALASCFSMALAHNLAEAGHAPDSIKSHATAHLEKQEGGWTITRIHLDVVGKVSGVTPESFQETANQTRTGCPVSRVLKADITMDARLA
jgi:osmotically inducible protein OsmC